MNSATSIRGKRGTVVLKPGRPSFSRVEGRTSKTVLVGARVQPLCRRPVEGGGGGGDGIHSSRKNRVRRVIFSTRWHISSSLKDTKFEQEIFLPVARKRRGGSTSRTRIFFRLLLPFNRIYRVYASCTVLINRRTRENTTRDKKKVVDGVVSSIVAVSSFLRLKT